MSWGIASEYPVLSMSAHSLIAALPKSTSPAALRRATTKISRGTMLPKRAQLPAVVFVLSLVAMLSLTVDGIPCCCCCCYYI
ncbi:hypothetical protein LZ30DRAFT_739500 [Colletotrichum cereale]|nr:hypothetical protein LZ30DRAFT_739500 [Colletotrichum cereale]